jgi:hypothetical protein
LQGCNGKIQNQQAMAQSTYSESSLKPTNHNCFVTFFAGTLAGLFIISTVVVLLLYFPTKQLLNPDFYKQSLVNHQIYQRLPEYIAQSLATGMTQDLCSQNPDSPDCINGESPISGVTPNDRPPIYFLILNQQDWETILTDLIDPSWIQMQTESVIDQIFHILLISPDPLNTPIDISLENVKANLAGEGATEAFLKILDAQPTCSLDQVLGLLNLGLGLPSTIDTILCRPPDYVISELTPVIQSFLISVANLIPDQVSINPLDTFLNTSSIETSPSLSTTPLPYQIQTLRLSNKAISLSPLVPFFLISLVTLIAVRSLRDFLIWWGSSLLSSGLFALLLSISILPIRNWALVQILPSDRNAFMGIPGFLLDLGFDDLIREMTSQLLSSIVIPAGLISLIGLLMLLGLVFLKNREANQPRTN